MDVRQLTIPEEGLKRPTRLAWIRVAGITGAAILLVGMAVVGSFFLAGGRWFVVETPSMGTAAPVGSIAITVPVDPTTLRVGDIITFHPPTAPSEVYTHRIVSLSADGSIGTRGDINGAGDPWQLNPADIIGRSSIVPHLGWLTRGLPLYLAGAAVIVLSSRLIRDHTHRTTIRLVSFSALFSAVVAVVRPFTGMNQLQTVTDGAGTAVTLASTGILPIHVASTSGASIDLVAGQVGTLLIPAGSPSGSYVISAIAHLTPLQWLAVVGVSLAPALWCFVVGVPIPSGRRARTRAQARPARRRSTLLIGQASQ